MDQSSFDRIARLLGGAASRRAGLLAALGAALGMGTLADAEAKSRGNRKGSGTPGSEGPCGDGSARDNRCKRNGDCCTRYCTPRGCRCKPNYMRCQKAAQCCSGRCVNRRCDGGAKPEGGACVENFNCQDGLACIDGICTKSSTAKCTPRNCQGCCDGTICRSGTAKSACGADGEACAVCSGADACTNGACGAPTPPDPCDTPTVCASGCPHTTIQGAITAAAAGDTILIGGGSYTEDLTIDKNLTLIGCAATTSVTVVNTGTNRTVSITSGAVVEIKDVGIDGTGTSTEKGGGIDNLGQLTLSGATKVMNGSMIASSELTGGCIYSHGAGNTVTMNDTASLDTCFADVGGGIRLSDQGILTMNDDARIVNCTGQRSGGGAYLYGNGSIVMTGSSEISGNSTTNTTQGGGAGVFLFGCALSMSGSSIITNNTSAYRAGGVAAFYDSGNSQKCDVTLTESATITANTSVTTDGSGLWSNNSSNTASGCAGITGNTPDPQTGGLTCS